MKNRSLPVILFLCFLPVASGAAVPDSLQKVSLQSYELFVLLHPWLQTTNPAGLSFNTCDLPVKAGFQGIHRQGDFKRVQEGSALNYAGASSEAYSTVHGNRLYGSFTYENSLEKDLAYSNSSDPYRGTPYGYIDTIGGDHYNREFFRLRGALSRSLGSSLLIGGACDYNVGVAVQGNDPRPENYVLDMTTRAGVIFAPGKIRIGLDLFHSYYNEQIDVDIVKENATMTMFRLLGPGVFMYHEAGTFNRQYKRNGNGADFQLNFSPANADLLLGARGTYFNESVQDGGKGGDASWIYLRNLAMLTGLDWHFYSNLQIRNNQNRHLLHLYLDLVSTLGTEIIEHLDPAGSLDELNWTFYLYDEKYGSRKTGLGVSYTFMTLQEQLLSDYRLTLSGNYNSFTEDYYLPDQHQDWSHILINVEGSKTFRLGRAILSLSAGVGFKKNLGGIQDFERSNFLVEKLLRPDFLFYTTDYYAPELGITFEKDVKRILSGIYIDTRFSRIEAADGRSMTTSRAGIGLIF
ncbi:MAG: DUF6850 family outer membrane beta-barrel protein [Bacteroidota bacterium]